MSTATKSKLTHYRIFGNRESEILCPHCEETMEEGHDLDACARKRMSRRYFFGVLAGGAALITIPEPPPLIICMDDFSDRYLAPAMARIASQIDRGSLFNPSMNVFAQYERDRPKIVAAMKSRRPGVFA